MTKKGHIMSNWKERWFVLTPRQLKYYTNNDESDLKGTVLITKTCKMEVRINVLTFHKVTLFWCLNLNNCAASYYLIINVIVELLKMAIIWSIFQACNVALIAFYLIVYIIISQSITMLLEYTTW